ncbi:MAG: adenylate/guanylate cyclase domain-containing protein [Planctomycetes bacterium]|nr:adenylate/guanylate cyclase domain-containing protein [Planctomycetota bacterium]
MAKTYSFEAEFLAPVAEVWRVVSDTDLIDGAIGLPAINYRDEPQPDGTTRRIASMRKLGIAIEYEEFPFTWVHEQMYEVTRVFSRGPFRTFRHSCELIPKDPEKPELGCTVRTSFTAETGGIFGPVAQRGTRKSVLAPYRKIFAQLDQKLRERKTREKSHTILMQRPVPLTEIDTRDRSEEEARAADFVARARKLLDSPLVDRIGSAVVRYPDEELRRMQPKAFAGRWKTPRDDTLNAFLACTRAGLLKMRWDVICPHCRGDKMNLGSLSDVREKAFCPSCNINFDIDLDRSLEAVFTPHPQVREVPGLHYCLGGPGTTPHIVYQKLLAPGEEHAFHIRLAPGRYRMRFTGCDDYRWFDLEEARNEAPAPAEFNITDTGVEGGDIKAAAGQPLPVKVRNSAKRRVVAVMESVEWARDALSAGELVADQRFRDLFSNEVLAPGIKLAVESTTILFTDLVGSTAMYNDLGDARAFSLVNTHFEVLHALVEKHQGAIVKTIGDAIMAVFTKPENALRAAHELHQQVDKYVREKGHERGCELKIGLHEGPCIAVTLNEKLDYFGTTVNLAARVQHMSQGGDIMVTQNLAQHTHDCEPLREQGWKSQTQEVHAKGFKQPVPVLRFTK